MDAAAVNGLVQTMQYDHYIWDISFHFNYITYKLFHFIRYI